MEVLGFSCWEVSGNFKCFLWFYILFIHLITHFVEVHLSTGSVDEIFILFIFSTKLSFFVANSFFTSSLTSRVRSVGYFGARIWKKTIKWINSWKSHFCLSFLEFCHFLNWFFEIIGVFHIWPDFFPQALHLEKKEIQWPLMKNAKNRRRKRENDETQNTVILKAHVQN